MQKCIDEISNNGGGIVHIPAGIYYFTTTTKLSRNGESYVIKCKNNVTIEGEGLSESTGTVLKPYGQTEAGLDMFYFNDYADSSFKNANYLVNANFRNFVIDGSRSKYTKIYYSGKRLYDKSI